MLLDQAQPRPFWNGRTLLFSACGLFAYLVSLWLFELRSAWVLIAVAIGRLALGIGLGTLIARRFEWRTAGSWYSVAFAVPYPLELALFIYAKRFDVLPRNVLLALSGPTSSVIFVTAVVLASRWITVRAMPAGIRDGQAQALRFLGGLLLVVTTIIVVLLPPPWSLLYLHYVPEPIALIGYSAIAARITEPAPARLPIPKRFE